ncbi:EamA family transporter [Vibrio inusitatus NBRC 102082]|uniref:EamA family transporter n=1 Tax=Vibrio inusitatus NBRC 102082 TaxID=1219070 RepID=A0A4Y3HR15_9VIBR|nr:EamA family transporter [Vibrio inusitatus]GEA49485.1 EamA family transporter [Vibrio inusitatus NBRC 102082]
MAGIVFIMIAAGLWAADTLFRYPLLETNSTLQIVFFEHIVLVVMIALLQVAVPRWRFAYIKGSLLSFILIGVLGSAIGTLAFTKAFTLMNPTIVILLQKLQPIVAISLSVLLLKEKLQKHFVLWASVSLIGSIVMIAPDIVELLSEGSVWHYDPKLIAILLGYGSALLAVLAWGASTVYGRKLTLMGYNTMQIMSGRFSLALVTLTIVMLCYGEHFTLSEGSFDNLFYMVLLSGLLGMFIYYKGLERVPARYGTIAELFFPVSAVVINWVAFDATLTSQQIAGAVLLVGGALMMSREPKQVLPSEPAAA